MKKTILISLIAILMLSSVSALKFVQVTDTHIIEGGAYVSGIKEDGRTDHVRWLVQYTEECSTGVCQWINQTTNLSIAPTIVYNQAINDINNLNPDFVVITGDLISNGDCGQDSNNSFKKFKEISDNLNMPYYVIGAKAHDNIDHPDCLRLYKSYFGDNVNWNFSDGENIFIGISEIYENDNDKYNLTFVNETLSSNKNTNSKLFLFTHTGINCYDFSVNGDFRCAPNEDLKDLINIYKSEYKSFVVISGHNHANIYDETDGVHYFTTTALMNYPTEFRIVNVRKRSIHTYMSNEVNPALSLLSKEIIENVGLYSPDLFSGLGTDRNKDIALLGTNPRNCCEAEEIGFWKTKI